MTDAEVPAFLPLPHLSYYVLLALASEPLHGWAIIKRIREMAGPRAAPSSGSLYLAMVRLEDRGLLEEAEAPADASDDERRRYYRMTKLGRAVLRAETARLAALVDIARREHGLDVATGGRVRPARS
ncbi:MAG: PadR family transcriptional regulator [Longimicrobiales bacterium]